MSDISKKQPFRLLVSFVALVLIFRASGQVILDGTLGKATTLSGPNYIITSDLGVIKGNNLFESFSIFNIATGNAATFEGPGNIQNIIGRITGGLTSNIDGTIKSDIPNANLFLVNPSGIIFGPTATLNVSGSFRATTADYILFSDGSKFASSPKEQSVLSIASPLAFGFLKQTPASITVNGSNLSVDTGKSIGFVAGNLAISGSTLTAPSGTISLVASGGPGEFPIQKMPINDPMTATGDLALTNNTTLNVTGGSNPSSAAVFIRAGRFVMDHATISAQNYGSEKGGSVIVDASSAIDLSTGSTIITAAHLTGSGGDIVLRSMGDIILSGNAGISSKTHSSGDAGEISISAQSLQLGDGSSITSQTTSSGNSLGISIDVQTLKVLQDARLTVDASGTGSGGLLDIRSNDVVINGDGSAERAAAILSTAEGSGTTAGVQISTATMTISGGGGIRTSSTGQGVAGPTNIAASNSIVISGAPLLLNSSGNPVLDPNGNPDHAESGITSTGGVNMQSGAAKGGSIVVSAPTLQIEDGGRIKSSGYGKTGDIDVNVSQLEIQGQTPNRSTSTFIGIEDLGSSEGGAVLIQASGSITLNGTAVVPRIFGADLSNLPDGIFNDAYAAGNAGDIVIKSPQIVMTGGALIRAGSGENAIPGASPIVTGNAGNITLQTDALTLQTGARIETQTVTKGHAGDIDINSNSIVIDGVGTLPNGTTVPTGIFSDTLGPGSGGIVTVSANTIGVLDGAAISAESHGVGDAGQIALAVGSSLLLQNASISTSATQSGGGQISIASAGNSALLHLIDGRITTSVAAGAGNAGDITLGQLGNPLPQIVIDDSQVRANAASGAGGHIQIFSDVFLSTPDSAISASAGPGGIPGVIDVQAAVSQLSQNFLPLRTVTPNELSLVACGGNGKSTLTTLKNTSSEITFPLVLEANVGARARIDIFCLHSDPFHLLFRR